MSVIDLSDGLLLPLGLQPTMPIPVDRWSGPYSGLTEDLAIIDALDTIQKDIRFPTMEVRILTPSGNQKYWFKDGVEDADLVVFGVDPTLLANEESARISGDTRLEQFITGLTAISHIQNTDSVLINPITQLQVVYVDNDGNTHIDGDIIQSGTGYTTSAQQLNIANDVIILRDGAISGIEATTGFTGIIVNKYDDIHDATLVFKRDGIARIGSDGLTGLTSPIALREDMPLEGGIAVWNSITNVFDTIDPATLVTSTGTTESLLEKVPYTGATKDVDLGIYSIKGSFIGDGSELTDIHISGVTNLNAILDGKSNTGHTHDISGVTNLQFILDGKSNTGHTHNISDVSGLTAELYNEYTGRTAADLLLNNQVTGLTSTVNSNYTDLYNKITGETHDRITGDTYNASLAGMIGPAPDGTYSDGVFSFVSGDTVGKAVDLFNEFFLKLAPAAPVDWYLTTMSLSTTNYTAKTLTNGVTVSSIVVTPTPSFLVVIPASGLSDASDGSLIFDVDNNIQEDYPVTGSTNKTSGVVGYTSGDPYLLTKPGIWFGFLSASAVSTALGASQIIKTAHYRHSTKGALVKAFYVDSVSTPTITNISASFPAINRFISGVPSISSGQTISNITFTINNAVSNFYNQNIYDITGSYITSKLNQAPQITHPATSGQTISITTGNTTTLNGVFNDTGFTFTVTARNIANTAGSLLYTNTIKRIDTVSVETDRKTSGTSLYPTTYGGVYNPTSWLTTGNTNELQLINNFYRWPTGNYTAYNNGPDYSSVTSGDIISGTTYRWATFMVGNTSVAAGNSNGYVSNITITIPNATIGSEYSDIKMYVKVSGNTSTEWVDGSLVSVAIPYYNGDGALNVGGSTKPNIRNITFGTVPRNGDVYVRIGIKSTTPTYAFKKPTMA